MARTLRELASYGTLGVRAAEFLDMRRAKHFSAGTIEWNESNLRAFFNWCEERSLRNPTEITRPILERYQRWLFYYRTKLGKPLTIASQHKRLAAVLAFFKWMAKSNMILFNPASEIDLPRLDRRLPRDVLTIAEVEHVLSLPDVTKLSGIRDRAMLETLYSTGIRRSELVRLGIYDVQPEAGTLMVRLGKGRKDRVVPIGERALSWIEKYLVEVRPKVVVEPDEGVLFISHLGNGFMPHTLTDIVRGYIEQAKIGKVGVVPSFPAHDGHLDAGERGRHPLHPGDAWARESRDDEHLHAGVDQEAQGSARADPPRGASRSTGIAEAGGQREGRRGIAYLFSRRG